MKTLLIILALLSVNVMAAEECSREEVVDQYNIDTKVPKGLEGATIIVQHKDGTTSKHKAEEFKVVPRKQQFITKKTILRECSPTESKKNRISLLGGRGPKPGLTSTTVSPVTLEIETNVGFVGGLQYQRKLGDTFSIGAQVQTNKTASAMIGIDF